MHQPMRLGELLMRAGVISEAQLRAGLVEQKHWGGKLGSVLVRMGALSEDLLVKALSKQLGIPRAQFGQPNVPLRVLERITRKVCEKNAMVPLAYIRERKALSVAVTDPFNVKLIDELAQKTGLRIEPRIAGESRIREAIKLIFGVSVSTFGEDDDEETELKLLDNQGASRHDHRDLGAEHRRIPTVIDRVAETDPGSPLQAEHARAQNRRLKALVSLLVEKGVFSENDARVFLS